VRADLATFDGVEGLYQAVQSTRRVSAAMALNAGVGVGGDFARDNELAAELRLIGLNVTGTVHLAKRVLPDMIAAGSGGVLFTFACCAKLTLQCQPRSGRLPGRHPHSGGVG
jgi:uncharacterized protein